MQIAHQLARALKTIQVADFGDEGHGHDPAIVTPQAAQSAGRAAMDPSTSTGVRLEQKRQRHTRKECHHDRHANEHAIQALHARLRTRLTHEHVLNNGRILSPDTVRKKALFCAVTKVA
jgi:hypothetical protein